jgi:hypothetical protein
METDLPIYGHTKTDFERALKLYRDRFGKDAPGSGYSNPRYQMVLSAISFDEPATQEDLERWETAARA